jgi:hypothetical protein
MLYQAKEQGRNRIASSDLTSDDSGLGITWEKKLSSAIDHRNSIN